MFDKFSTIKDLRAFGKMLYDALYDFCEDRETYDEDVILGINTVTLDVKARNPYFVQLGYETYELENSLLATSRTNMQCTTSPTNTFS